MLVASRVNAGSPIMEVMGVSALAARTKTVLYPTSIWPVLA